MMLQSNRKQLPMWLKTLATFAKAIGGDEARDEPSARVVLLVLVSALDLAASLLKPSEQHLTSRDAEAVFQLGHAASLLVDAALRWPAAAAWLEKPLLGEGRLLLWLVAFHQAGHLSVTSHLLLLAEAVLAALSSQDSGERGAGGVGAPGGPAGQGGGLHGAHSQVMARRAVVIQVMLWWPRASYL